MEEAPTRAFFQPGEGPSRGLLRDYEPSDGPFWSTSAELRLSSDYRYFFLIGRYFAIIEF